jgi:acyl-CoA synthetase (NDP forming)
LVVTLVATRTNDLPAALAALTEAADEQPNLPMIAVVVSADAPLQLGRGNLPVYELLEDAVRSLGHACRYARWRREPAASDFPEVSELDLNPVVAVPSGVAALDIKIKLAPAKDEPDAYARSLASPGAYHPPQ